MAEKLELTAAQQQALTAAGIDWSKLLAWLATKGPAIVYLFRELLDLILTPTPVPVPVMGAAHHEDAHAATLQALQASLCAAHCAAVAHAVVCEEGGH